MLVNSISDPKNVTPFKPKAMPEFPAWIVKLLKRHDQLNRKYEKAHNQFAEAYEEFLMAVTEINEINGTNFSLEQALKEFEGKELADTFDDDDDEDDEDE